MVDGYKSASQIARVLTEDWFAHKSPELKAWQKTVNPPRRLGNERFISALFKDPTKVEDAEKLMTELHAVASDMQDVGLKLDFYQFFTSRIMSGCGFVMGKLPTTMGLLSVRP